MRQKARKISANTVPTGKLRANADLQVSKGLPDLGIYFDIYFLVAGVHSPRGITLLEPRGRARVPLFFKKIDPASSRWDYGDYSDDYETHQPHVYSFLDILREQKVESGGSLRPAIELLDVVVDDIRKCFFSDVSQRDVAMDRRGELPASLVFSDNIPETGRKYVGSHFQRRGFVLNNVFSTPSECLIEALSKEGRMPDSHDIVVVAEALNRNLNYSLIECGHPGFTRKHFQTIPGYGIDSRIRALAELVVDQLNALHPLLHTTEEKEREYDLHERKARKWVDHLDPSNPRPLTIKKCGLTTVQEYTGYNVTITREEIADKVRKRVSDIAATLHQFVTETANVELDQVDCCLYIGESLTKNEDLIKEYTRHFENAEHECIENAAGLIIEGALEIAVARAAQVRPPALLAIETDPDGAEVYVDGEKVGIAPLKHSLDSGSHEIAVVLDGYLEESQRVSLEPGANEAVEIKLVPLTASLEIQTTPPDAQVFVDNKSLGPSPVRCDVTPGKHTLTANLAGYEKVSRKIIVEPGTNQTIQLTLDQETPTDSVRIETDPAGAEILVNGQSRGPSPVTLSLEPGKYLLFARLKGYKPAHQGVAVAAGTTQTIKLSLQRVEKQKGLVKIEPIEDRRSVGVKSSAEQTDPVAIDRKPKPRSYWKVLLPVAAIGFGLLWFVPQSSPEEAVREPVIRGTETGIEREPGRSVAVALRVESVPTDAEVFINDDGLSRGRTNITLSLDPGNYGVTVRRDGYLEQTRNVSLTRGRDGQVRFTLQRAPTPPPAAGSATFTATPWADVFLNGESIGRTPVRRDRLQPGTYTVKMIIPDWDEWESRFTLQPGENASISRTFKPYAHLNVNAQPWAYVYIDGEPHGETPRQIRFIAPGRRVIRVEHPTLGSQERVVELVNGESHTESFRFNE